MQFAGIFTAALTVATASAASGNTFNNHCSFNVYVQPQPGATTYTVAPGKSLFEAFASGGNGTMRFSTSNPSSGSEVQFEYSESDGNIFYDLSTINGDPFRGYTFNLTPLTITGPTCKAIYCDANGAGDCQTEFNQPATDACTAGTSFATNLCT